MPSADRFSLPRSRHFLLHELLLLLMSVLLIHGQDELLPTANLSTLWAINSTDSETRISTAGNDLDLSIIRHILLHSPTAELTFACGFYSNRSFDGFLLAVYAINTNKTTPRHWSNPQVVWSANRDRLVGENAVLHFTADGDLVLRGADGSKVWSTGTAGKGVVGANITAAGNLVLFDEENEVAWQSFDHPTDVLVLGQNLKEGQRLVANRTLADWARGQFYLTLGADDLYAYIDSNPPQPYYNFFNHSRKNSTYLEYKNCSLGLITDQITSVLNDSYVKLPAAAASSVQFLKLESDGHTRAYQWTSEGWNMVFDVFQLGFCDYPTVCGEYGICDDGKCSCGVGWKPNDSEHASLGCSPANPLSCESVKDHKFQDNLTNVSYFIPADSTDKTFEEIDEVDCRQRCLENCSCKAAVFHHSTAHCLLLSQVFSMNKFDIWRRSNGSSIYVKVQVNEAAEASKSTRRVSKFVGSFVSAAFSSSFFILIGVLIMALSRRKKYEEEEAGDEEYFFGQAAAGMPTRFSFEELRLATENFSRKIGEGGSGSVYEGKIGGERVAVKRFDGFGQGKKEFLAEVETVGGVHHINLVRLIGFCAEKSHRLLVYEYMCNGSLDRWIFSKSQGVSLDWQTRRKIIAGTAKGLAYLHEECRQRIAHLDIKPQNILLDERFDAKISDFGMSKLIGREESGVMTRMRGTPGYLAPEWLTSVITEKVDVYSFGVVVVEIICGRRNLDFSRPPGGRFHLLTLLLEKMETDRLVEIIGDRGGDMEMHWGQVTEMVRLAIWCLQRDSSRRPSMSTVVKILEGAASVAEEHIDYDLFSASPLVLRKADDEYYCGSSSPVCTPTQLSGPR